MRDDLIDITVLLDRSGSMATTAQDMEGGFKTFLEAQRAAPGETRMSLHQFDDVYETVYQGALAKDAQPLSLAPRGSTALLDAMARCIRDTGARFASMPEAQRPGKVMFVVVTDGHENASTKTTRQQVSDLIREQREVYKWEFVYLGANQDAFDVAGQLGINLANVGNYKQTSGGIAAMYNAVTRSSMAVRGGNGAAVTIGEDEDKS